MRYIARKPIIATVLAIAMTLLYGHASAQTYEPYSRIAQEQPSANAMTADVLIARPGGIVATAAGTVVFLLALPFSLISGDTERVAQQLIVKPANYTFARPLGKDIIYSNR